MKSVRMKSLAAGVMLSIASAFGTPSPAAILPAHNISLCPREVKLDDEPEAGQGGKVGKSKAKKNRSKAQKKSRKANRK